MIINDNQSYRTKLVSEIKVPGTSDTSDVSDTSDAINTANSSDASKISAHL